MGHDEPLIPEDDDEDYLPKDDAGFDAWMKNFITVLSANTGALGVSPKEVAALAAHHAAWQEAWKAERHARTALVAAKERLRNDFVKFAPHLPPGPSGLPS